MRVEEEEEKKGDPKFALLPFRIHLGVKDFFFFFRECCLNLNAYLGGMSFPDLQVLKAERC